MTRDEYTGWLLRFKQAQEEHDINPSAIMILQLALTTLQYIEAVEARDCRKFDRQWLEDELARHCMETAEVAQ